MKIKQLHLKQLAIPSTTLLFFLCSFPNYAQQTDEEMLAEAQRKMNAKIFGVKPLAPKRSKLEIYIENAQQNNIQPRDTPPSYWSQGYNCAMLEQRSYIDYRDCMYYFHINERYWEYPAVLNEPKPVIVKRKVVTNRTQEFAISEEYDEDALNNYYKWLKNYAPLMNTIGMVTSEQIKQKTTAGFNYQSLFTILSSSLESTKIELEAWPFEIRQKAWKAMGKRIEAHSKLFEKYRKLALENEAIDPVFKNSLKSITLIEKESFLTE